MDLLTTRSSCLACLNYNSRDLLLFTRVLASLHVRQSLVYTHSIQLVVAISRESSNSVDTVTEYDLAYHFGLQVATIRLWRGRYTAQFAHFQNSITL